MGKWVTTFSSLVINHLVMPTSRHQILSATAADKICVKSLTRGDDVTG